MSYLRLIKDKAQEISKDVCSALDVDVTITDENLVRICGTGSFSSMINKYSPENSIFAQVLNEKKPLTVKARERDPICRTCSNYDKCDEISNMAYPIIVDDKVMGIVSFAAFNKKQLDLMQKKWKQYFKLLERIATILEKEIINIKMANTLIIQKAEINELINSIDRGILIADISNKITHINSKALEMLRLDLTKDKIIGKRVNKIIKGIKIGKAEERQVIDVWEINGYKARFLYRITEVSLEGQKLSTLIDFMSLTEIINTAMHYTANEGITFSHIIGNSSCLKETIERSKIVAKSESTVLLQGESGTGKELFARAIHNASSRRNGPFIAINCSAIPENLLESELFGYERGAFTGASEGGKIGKMELANNGTLFLDEIGDLPLHLQPKLLRALQGQEITRIGGKTGIKINIRIISATHKDLYKLVKSRQFREDLYYRLNVIPLLIPPLRERENDVIILSEYILEKLSHKMDIKQKKLSREVEDKFLSYSWPGNVRELENVLEYAANFSKTQMIKLNDLPEYILRDDKKHRGGLLENGLTLDEMVRQYEKNILHKYIDFYGDTVKSKKKIAKKLGIGLTTLYRKLGES